VLGTTDTPVKDPDEFTVTAAEVTRLLEEGEKLVPGFASYRVLRSWAGVRPLYQEQEHEATGNRDISRTYRLLDHSERDGVEGLLSIVGGKWTTFRLMAEEVVNAIAARLGVTTPCRTHEEPLDEPDETRSGSEAGTFYWLGQNLAHVETGLTYGDLICECEMVTRQQVIECITSGTPQTIEDIRRETRLGMGPCQGGFCTYRVVGLWQESSEPTVRRGASASVPRLPWGGLILNFLQKRWKGGRPILWGNQLRQERLNQFIYLDILGVDLLPEHLTRQDKASHT
jgi:glycerol-3-phosphate dehydrogenase